MTSDPAIDIFKQNWETYRKLIFHNYMFHRQRNEETDQIFQRWTRPGKINILDLGCGDAYWVKSLTFRERIKSYTGIDLSPAALEYASQNLAALNLEADFHTGRMEEMIHQVRAGFQWIYSAYAIHHLRDAIKQELFKVLYNLLEDGGVFILIDVFRKPGQSREDYLADYSSNMERRWTALNPHDLSLISSHVLQFDFPSRIDKVRTWLSAIGFKLEEGEFVDDYHKMLILSK